MAPRVQDGARIIGRYALHDEIAAGGMATVHLGRLLGQAGFSRIVAIKRLHPQYAKDPDFVSMFVDEARLAARIHHPNVVATLDVYAREGELFLVMEYIRGESLSALLRRAAFEEERVEPRIGAAIVVGLLHGLHAAHEAQSERGEPLEIVHRDVSPQNVLVGIDGIPRVVDFGVAKAQGRVATTRDGELKGKLAYMAPEQIQGGAVNRQTDIYSASIVLWELLTGKRLLKRDTEAAVIHAALTSTPAAPSTLAPGISEKLDRITLRGLERSPDRRFPTALDMALALEQALDLARPTEIGAWVQRTAKETLARRALRVADVESDSVGLHPHSSRPPPPEASPTQMTASSPKSLAPPSRRKLGVALGLPILAAAAALVLVAHFSTAQPTAHSPTAAGTGSDSPSIPPLDQDHPAASTSSVGSLTTTIPSAIPPPLPATPATSVPSRARSPGVPAHAGHSDRPARVAGGCDPPFRVDSSGHNIFKVECL